MPQLVKGGKNVFGWSVVNENGRIVIPLDAFTEYRFINGEKVILMSGSKKSGGFGLTTLKLLKGSPLSRILGTNPELAEFRIREGEGIDSNSKIYCWVTINNRSIFVPRDTLKMYGIRKKDYLLTVRGSSLSLGFIIRGPIIEEAKRHPELEIFK